MKNYVKISSTINISVTSGLQHRDVTNPDAHVADRLKVNPLWPKMTLDIRQGVHYYPGEITEWNTVKALVNDKVLTIGEFVDEVEEPEAIQMKQKLNKVMGIAEKESVKKQSTSVKKKAKEEINLEDLTEVE